MICILHGYLLEGSGSNLWTRSVIHSLCRKGEVVHLVCQENHPEQYDFIAEVYHYTQQGDVEEKLRREVPYPGRCVMHKPELGELLPVYVWDKYEEFPRVVPMIELADEEINSYLSRNVEVSFRIVKEQGITVLHANHAVLMSVVAQRVGETTGLPFAVMPHGSAIEYAVKKDARFLKYAEDAFGAAARVFVIGEEIRQRLLGIFSPAAGLNQKMIELSLGADTSLFEPIAKESRGRNIEGLKASVSNLPKGKPQAHFQAMVGQLNPDLDLGEMKTILAAANEYATKCPDEDITAKLDLIDWERDELMLFVGRLIASKGIQSVVAALPLLFDRHPNLKLLVVGHGPLREPLEALLWAFEQGHSGLVEKMVAWGKGMEGSHETPFEEVRHFLAKLRLESELDDYFQKGLRSLRSDRVIFTGYLTHTQLRYLFPCCDLAIFPSVVKEAGPLVFLEALASGVYPLGTYFGGMGVSIDLVSEILRAEDARWMKLSTDSESTVSDIVRNVTGALELDGKHSRTLRELAVERFDWSNVSAKLTAELQAVSS
jgi:glycosyltransferase involved in cell wall biosynthesis